MRDTWEKTLEYASMPRHGTLSRKLRKGVRVQINEGRIYENAILFLGERFVRFTEEEGGISVNTYFDWDKIASIRTYSEKE
jgi:hypothetical protein